MKAPLFKLATITALLLFAGPGSRLLMAQEDDPAPPPPPPGTDELVLPDNFPPPEGMPPVEESPVQANEPSNQPSHASPTPAAQQPAPQSYDRSGDRRSYRRSGRDYSGQSQWSRRDFSSRSDGSPSPETLSSTNRAPGRPDFSAFKLIYERNIFDPNRRAYRSEPPRERPKTIESFALVGVMSYDKGTFAFFDGTSSSYRKALKQNDSIAGYTVTSIAPSAVQLAAGTNHVELGVGMQLRREEQGQWIPSRQTESFSALVPASPTTTLSTPTTQTDAPTASSSSGGSSESDILRRLRERRERE